MPTKTETLLSSLKINKLTRSQFLTAKAADEVDLDNEFYMTGEVLGEGDMLKEVYDKNGNGIVDNSEKVNGLTVLTAVPANAKFTDTTYSTFKGASSSAAGGAGLVPAPSSGQQSLFLRGDGIWASTPQPTVNNSTITITQNGISKGAFGLNQTNGLTIPLTDTTYSQATSTTLGLVKIGYTASGKNYPVSLSSEGKMFVNVPWTDTNTTYSVATQSANGLLSSTDKTKLDGIASGANNYSLPAASSTIRGGIKLGYSTNGKNYAVQATNEQLYVNVPWTDTNTTYSQATSSTLGLIKIGYTESGKNYPIELNTSGQAYVNVPWEDTTYSIFTGATTTAAGTSGLVPAPTSGQSTRYLCSTGEWSIPTGTIYNGSTTISVKPSTTDGEYNIYLVALFPGTTSQSVGPSASGTINFGSAFNVPYITIDQYGRITALANRSMILSGALASSSAPGLCPKLDSSHPSYYLNANGSWSLPRGRVYGVKGDAETDYREGQVNITAANIGALSLSSGGTVAGATTFSSDVTISGELNYDGGFY